MADLRAPGFHAAGVTLPGLPFVIAGHNEHVAWGFTALYGDVQDLYVEKLDGKGNYQAATAAGSRSPSTTKSFTCAAAKMSTLDVQSTEHGPLLNPHLRQATHAPSRSSGRSTIRRSTRIPLYEMNTASNWTEFSAALAQWCWPTQNVVYSDDQGHIAYHAVGRVPLRPAGLAGLAHSATRRMSGRATFLSTRCPTPFDPPSGFLATANSRVTTDKSPYPLTLEWADPYRTERIYKALQGRDQLTPTDMLAVQTDIYSEVDQETGHRFAYAIDHTAGADDAPAQGRRPDAQLGWPPHHRLRRRLDRDPDPRRAVAA